MSTINHSDWNPVQTKIASVLGTPDGTTADLGYNTSVTSSQVATGATITGAQWNDLRTDINKAYTHQTGSASDLTTRAAGVKISAADLTTISARATTAYNNRNTFDNGQLTYVAGPGQNINGTWYDVGSLSFGTITFASNAAYRGFWNGGGKLVFSGSRSGGSATSQNQAWTNLLANMGSIVLTRTGMFQTGQNWNGTFYNSFGSGGVYGTSATTLGGVEAFRIYSQDTNYTPNFVTIFLNHDNADVNLRTSITVLMNYSDSHVGLGGGPDYVDGNTIGRCDIYYPYATAKPNNY